MESPQTTCIEAGEVLSAAIGFGNSIDAEKGKINLKVSLSPLMVVVLSGRLLLLGLVQIIVEFIIILTAFTPT
jgi:hypothetical protein